MAFSMAFSGIARGAEVVGPPTEGVMVKMSLGLSSTAPSASRPGHVGVGDLRGRLSVRNALLDIDNERVSKG